MLFLSREILSLSLEKVLFLVLCVQLCKGEVLLVEVQGMQQAAVMISFLLTVKKLCLEMLMLTSLSYQPCLLKSSNISKGLKYPVWTLCIPVHCVYLYGFCCKLFFCSFQNIISTGQPGVLSQVQWVVILTVLLYGRWLAGRMEAAGLEADGERPIPRSSLAVCPLQHTLWAAVWPELLSSGLEKAGSSELSLLRSSRHLGWRRAYFSSLSKSLKSMELISWE